MPARKLQGVKEAPVEPEIAKLENSTPTTYNTKQSHARNDDSAKSANTSSPSKKPKRQPSPQSEPHKAPRRSTRSAAKPQPPQLHLKYLLSPAALMLCRSTDESKDLFNHKEGLRTYSSSTLSPFEEPLCAVIISRPISHVLGHRTIRTVLNPPYDFTSPKAITKAGKEGIHQAVWNARTQHKDKTAAEIELVANVVAEKFAKDGPEDTSLDLVRERAGKDVEKERELLKSSIKGLGKMGLNIFIRRVQWLWTESFPLMDDRVRKAAEQLGLPGDPTQLNKLVEDHWDDLDGMKVEGANEAERKRRAFVIILERAIGAQLERKVDMVLEAASRA